MKNLFKVSLVIIMLVIAQPSQSKDLVRTSALTNRGETIDATEAQKLINRLKEIKALDKRNMTKSERRALRKEVKATEKRLSASGGVYLSVGAVIIIILLLILLL